MGYVFTVAIPLPTSKIMPQGNYRLNYPWQMGRLVFPKNDFGHYLSVKKLTLGTTTTEE
jgi:hypothetical protein